MTDEQANDFGECIRKLRMARGWSARQLASFANIDASVVTHLESGKARKPQVSTLRDLASALDIPLAELFVAAGYATTCQVPCIGVHLRLCYSHLPEEVIQKIEAFANQEIAEAEHKQKREIATENQT
ncbi:helix-turn-helix domain-containing protein [Nocardiopsis changdeensis]|uniref:helix-turn-helix domain-containing protein n=1 Tax=Nocardiopsis changdeensis TaxID=2831969 RepID=UPI003F473621